MEKELNNKETIDSRNYQELAEAFSLADHTVYKRYLSELSEYQIVEPGKLVLAEIPEKCLREFQLIHFSNKKGEDIFQKLSTVYHASMALGCSLYVMIDVKSIHTDAEIYLGIRHSDEQEMGKLITSYAALSKGMVSNFPGTEIRNVSASKELREQIDSIFGADTKCISTVSCIAAIRDKKKTEHKDFIQGIEKLIDTMRGHAYTALFIAEPVSSEQQAEIRSGYEELYSTFSPFRKSVWTYNENDSTAVMESLSTGVSNTVTQGVSQTQSHTFAKTKGTANTVNVGMNVGLNRSNSVSTTQTETVTAPTAAARAGNAMAAIGRGMNSTAGKLLIDAALLGGSAVFPPLAVAGPLIKKIVATGALEAVGSAMQGSSKSESISNTTGSSSGIFGGLNAGYAHTSSHSTTESDTEAHTDSHSESKGESETTTKGTTTTRGNGRTLQTEIDNKLVEEMLQRIDNQLKRIKEFEDYGAYNCGAYFLSGKQESSILAANTYRALMIGDGSGVETGAVNIWTDSEKVSVMKEYLKRIEQPVFYLPMIDEQGNTHSYVTYSAGTMVSGLELPLHLGLPTKSVAGLSVIEHAEFGRNVKTEEPGIGIGQIYHMGETDKNMSVSLNLKSLTSHTFVTGSTGTGKSNTVYQLIDKVRSKGIPFMVIEPAKGEYKECLGENCNVFGTNATETELLYINPFSFPEKIHILEHIDRLVEILNACWPMYAAMPAVLKDSIERVYVNKGWNLLKSKCGVKGRPFPTFADLLVTLPEVMEESSYSADTKSDYSGALVTRVKSLTNGLNGQLLCSGIEIDEKTLFEENTIIDLSRIGAMETRSLFMGILVMKLQEYHMSRKQDMNGELRHLTVLEEAHNLLRRTAINQTQESSNLQGKSVEMITNSIAEMRTYGEGFVIVDQAPGLLDEAVIRNTNTKIILRLPYSEDREIVGKAVALNDDQIKEIAKLPKGVAVLYQNDWLEAVLCHFDKYEDKKPYVRGNEQKQLPQALFYKHIFTDEGFKVLREEEVDSVLAWIESSKYARETKRILKRAVKDYTLTEQEKQLIAYNLFEGKTVAKLLSSALTEQEGVENAEYFIQMNTDIINNSTIKFIRQMIIQAIVSQNEDSDLAKRYVEYSGKIR